MSSQLRPEERKDVHEIVVGAIEHKATFDTKWIGNGITGRHTIQNNFRKETIQSFVCNEVGTWDGGSA